MGCSPWGLKEPDTTEVPEHARLHARTRPWAESWPTARTQAVPSPPACGLNHLTGASPETGAGVAWTAPVTVGRRSPSLGDKRGLGRHSPSLGDKRGLAKPLGCEEGACVEAVPASSQHLPRLQAHFLPYREDRTHRVMTPVTSESGCSIPLLCIFNPLLLAGSSPFLSFYLNILIMVMFIKRALTFWGYIIKYLCFEWQGVWDLLPNSPESGQQQAERSKSGREFVTSESGGWLSGESPHSAFTFSRRI